MPSSDDVAVVIVVLLGWVRLKERLQKTSTFPDCDDSVDDLSKVREGFQSSTASLLVQEFLRLILRFINLKRRKQLCRTQYGSPKMFEGLVRRASIATS